MAEAEAGLPSDVLLRGALYALEQCGLLLTDAAALVEQRRYQTGVAVGLLGREELGRHTILLDLWRRSAAGESITHKQVVKACDDHVEKQRRSGLNLTYRMREGDQVDQLVRARQNASPGSDEWRAADEQLKLIDEHRRRQLPNDRHEKRMSAIYVDLTDGDTWSRPCDLDAQYCADEVRDALNDYTRGRSRIDDAATVYEDDQLAQAVMALVGRPTVPPTPQLSIEAQLPSSIVKKAPASKLAEERRRVMGWMMHFFGGVLVGAACALALYLTLVLPRVEENARIGGFVNGAHVVLIAVDEELGNAPNVTAAVKHVEAWRGCGIVGFTGDWPGAYRRFQAVENTHPGNGWHAHIAAVCSPADLKDTQ